MSALITYEDLVADDIVACTRYAIITWTCILGRHNDISTVRPLMKLHGSILYPGARLVLIQAVEEIFRVAGVVLAFEEIVCDGWRRDFHERSL
jgi:hypothetical protein